MTVLPQLAYEGAVRALESLDDEEVLRLLARGLDLVHQRNRGSLNAMQSLLRIVAVGLLVQILAWTVALAGTL